MAYVSKLKGLQLGPNGSIIWDDVWVVGGEIGGPHAMALFFHDNERSMARVEFYYPTRSLEERYARFTARLDAALAGVRKPEPELPPYDIRIGVG